MIEYIQRTGLLKKTIHPDKLHNSGKASHKPFAAAIGAVAVISITILIPSTQILLSLH
jgi:hypothetical protein